MPTDKEVVILSEEDLKQIEARLKSWDKGEISKQTFPASWANVSALCQTVRALRGNLNALRQQVEDTIVVAKTDEDADGFISAYHFQTGAIHRLLAEARKGG